MPGTYTVTLIVTSPTAPPVIGTSPNQQPCPQCVDSVKHTLVINNLPGPPIECIATVCANEEATYCTPALPCATYTWTVTGGTFTGQGTPCITVQWGNGNPQGSITLVITGCPNYCAQGTTVTVPIIPATTTINGNDTVCVNSNETYSLPAWPGTTYNWSLSGGGNIVGNNTNTASINVNWTTVGTFVITCTYFDSALNCGGTGTITVKVLPNGKITGLTKFCAGSSITLNAKDQFNNPIVATWTAPPGINFPGGNVGSSVIVSSNTPGTYIITATPGPGIICGAPTYTVTVLPQPILNPIVGADSICPGKTYVYSISSNTTAAFTWVINNGTASFLSANNDSAQITWGPSGPYSISITQTSASGCVSNAQLLNVFAFPNPVISGPINVCADDIVTYSISNMGNHPFVWSVSPANYGTIQSGQGTNAITIKWHGSVNPGSNTVYLHVSLCKDDSIAITINKPVPPTITSAGTLCGVGGISLSASGTGTFNWTRVEGGYTFSGSTATGITLPGHYTVCIGNYNGSGCTVCKTFIVPDIGRPTATISASNVLNYCLPNTPNMNLVAASGAGYSYQWYFLNPTPVAVGTNSPILAINTLTAAGTYTYYCVVSLNGCSVQSNSITITIQNCTGNPGGPGCTGVLGISNITGCNPFTVTPVATGPAGATVIGGTTTISYPYTGYPTTSGNTSMTFDSVGYKQITVCADISLPGGGTTRCCKDTVVLVTVAAKFLPNDSCGKVTLTDLSTVISPATIGSYSWAVGAFPGNTPVPPVVASFNNPAAASPILTVTVTGTYIITQTITSGSCTVSFMDTIMVSVPDASFTVSNSCVGTSVILNSAFVYQSYLWDFGDFATSYTQNTSHAYAATGTYTITHTVTDVNGCSNTATQPITINPKPTCNITYTTPLLFCQGDSVVLKACAGFTGYQWFNNAVAIPLATNQTYTAIQTGNYSFTAYNNNGCLVISDTISVNVTPAPNAVITASGSYCVGGTFNISVQSCNTCTFVWLDNAVPIPGFNSNQGTFPVTMSMVGTHTYTVIVTDTNTGCSATGSITVTFNNIPTVSISVAPNVPVLCSNNVYTLTAASNAVSPAWAWTYNFGNIVLSNTNTLNASAGGTYIVNVTDGTTGCSNSTFQVINPSPDLSLFPSGCDSLCDTSKIFLPLGSINGNIGNYTINWYNDAPVYANVIGTGPSLNLNTLPLGNNTISVIVINNITGCADTSNNYNIYIRHCAGCSCLGSSWDSLYWHHNPPIIDGLVGKIAGLIKEGIGKKDAASNNVITPLVDTAFSCGQSLGQFNCNSPITIFAKYKCNPASCDSAVKYTLTGPVNLNGVMPLNTSGFPAGNYTLTMIGKCGDSVCKTCIVTFSIHCDTTHVNCTCAGSSWDSLHFHHGLPGGGGQGGGDNGLLKKIEKIITQNVTGIPVDTSFTCGQNIGTFNCNDPITIYAKYKCNPGSCDSAVKYVLTGPVTMTGVMPFTTYGLPAGNYVLIMTGKCGDSICKVCDVPFSILCDTTHVTCSCVGSSWDSLHFNHLPPNAGTGGGTGGGGDGGLTKAAGIISIGTAIGTPGNADTAFVCGQNLGQFNCNSPITLYAKYRCNPAACDSAVKYVLTGPVTLTGIMPFYTGSLPAGNYIFTMTGKCGDSICNTCQVRFSIKCDTACTCTNSHWDSLYYHHAPHDGFNVKGDRENVVIVPVDTAIFCGKNIGQFNCIDPITIFAKYKCSPASCDSAVKYVLTGPVTMTGVMPFSTYGLPAGNYVLILTGKCGDSICNVCDIPFSIRCDTTHVNCCANSHWVEGPVWINNGNHTSTFINCSAGTSSFLINTQNKNCFIPTIVKGTYACATGCTSTTVYQLYDSLTNALITTSNDSLIIAGSLTNGSYYVKIFAYCGGVLCNTCSFKFKKSCACDCDSSKVIVATITTNNSPKKYNCGANLGIINCTNNVLMSATYSCTPTSCPSSINYQLTGPFGVTTGTLPLLLNTLTQGSYSVLLTAYCNGKSCKQCNFTFTIKCDSVPPPPCCPYNIGISSNNTTYSLTPTGNATVFSPVFTISGLAGIPLSEVKAEVLSYSISSNYNNECLNCKTLPFTWASIAGATNIGAMPPQITLYGVTAPSFTPTGTAIYQNPREVTWGNGTPFLISAPVGINFYLPPPPIIECCELSGSICVKFTFKDTKCKVCEVISCINFSISNGNIFKFCSPRIAIAD